MDYYQSSNPPELDPKNLSGGVAFQFNGAIAAGGSRGSGVVGGGASNPVMQKITIQVCVDGVAKSLDVYAAGQPYTPPA
jgi:hypothetical protein